MKIKFWKVVAFGLIVFTIILFVFYYFSSSTIKNLPAKLAPMQKNIGLERKEKSLGKNVSDTNAAASSDLFTGIVVRLEENKGVNLLEAISKIVS